MSSTTMLHVRIDEQIKIQAASAFASMGLTVSDAVRVFLMRVVADQQMPFELKVPNTQTRTAMLEAGAILSQRKARFNSASELLNDLEKNSRQ
jgi:DNA-damage-inducible protein J